MPGWSQVSSAGRCRPGVLSGVNVGRDPTTGRGLPQRAGTERARWVTRGVGFGRPCQGKRRESGRRRRTLFLFSVCVCAHVCLSVRRVWVWLLHPCFREKYRSWRKPEQAQQVVEGTKKQRISEGKRDCVAGRGIVCWKW